MKSWTRCAFWRLWRRLCECDERTSENVRKSATDGCVICIWPHITRPMHECEFSEENPRAQCVVPSSRLVQWGSRGWGRGKKQHHHSETHQSTFQRNSSETIVLYNDRFIALTENSKRPEDNSNKNLQIQKGATTFHFANFELQQIHFILK